MEQIVRETYLRTAKLDSDLQRLSHKVDTNGRHASMEICCLGLMMVPSLFLLFLAILLA